MSYFCSLSNEFDIFLCLAAVIKGPYTNIAVGNTLIYSVVTNKGIVHEIQGC